MNAKTIVYIYSHNFLPCTIQGYHFVGKTSARPRTACRQNTSVGNRNGSNEKEVAET